MLCVLYASRQKVAGGFSENAFFTFTYTYIFSCIFIDVYYCLAGHDVTMQSSFPSRNHYESSAVVIIHYHNSRNSL